MREDVVMAEGRTARLSIGEFSALTRLSHRALRLYDSLGLLPPAEIDEWSGYRYYAPGQAEAARTIRLLRGVGVPLARIGELLAMPRPAAAEAVRAYWREEEDSHLARRHLAHYLVDLLEERTRDVYEIQTRSVPDQKVVSTQRKVAVDELPGFIARAGDHLIQYLRRHGRAPVGAAFVVYHGEVNEDADGPVEMCVPVEGTVEPSADASYPVGVRMEPAHTEAFARITKAEVRYPAILRAYDAVAGWLGGHDELRSGPPREVYFADWDSAGDDTPVCDVAFPYSPREGGRP